MKIFIAIILFSLNSWAGSAKLTWCHDGSAVDGSKVPITGFKIYWRFHGQTTEQTIQFGNGLFMPDPWKIEPNGMKWWSQTLTKDDVWLPGVRVCFRMTAFSFDEESAKTNEVCKVFSEDPNAPILINLNP